MRVLNVSFVIALVFGVWAWIEVRDPISGVLALLIIWFILHLINLVIELFTTKEGGIILGILALIGLGFLLGSDDDDLDV